MKKKKILPVRWGKNSKNGFILSPPPPPPK